MKNKELHLEKDFWEYFKNDRLAKILGIELIDFKPGYSKVRVEISDIHLNAADITHGGLLFTLADFAFAVACNSHGPLALAINVNMSFFKGTTKGDILVAEAKEINLHKKLGNYQVDIKNQNDELVAAFQGTCFRKT